MKERRLQEQWDIVGWWIYQSYQFALAADPRKEDWADSFSLSLSLAIHSITHMSGRKVQVENDGTYAIPKKNLRNSRVGIWKERRTRRISGWMTSGTEWTLCRRSERKQLSIVFIKGQKVMRMKGAGYFWSKHDIYFFPSIFDFKTTKTVGPIVREHWSGVQHLWFILLHGSCYSSIQNFLKYFCIDFCFNISTDNWLKVKTWSFIFCGLSLTNYMLKSDIKPSVWPLVCQNCSTSLTLDVWSTLLSL